MADLLIDVPDELLGALADSARKNGRSVEDELRAMLEDAAKESMRREEK